MTSGLPANVAVYPDGHSVELVSLRYVSPRDANHGPIHGPDHDGSWLIARGRITQQKESGTMHIYTELAVDAFRRQEQARRRLAKAEARTSEAVRRLRDLPDAEYEAERDVWFAETEKIRLAIDEQDGQEAARHRPDLVPLRHPGV